MSRESIAAQIATFAVDLINNLRKANLKYKEETEEIEHDLSTTQAISSEEINQKIQILQQQFKQEIEQKEHDFQVKIEKKKQKADVRERLKHQKKFVQFLSLVSQDTKPGHLQGNLDNSSILPHKLSRI